MIDMDIKNSSDFQILKRATKGGYDVIRRIGAGSSGRVYLGRRVSTGHTVVLKFLQINSKEGAARVKREIEVLAKINSPYIASLIDSFHLPEEGVSVLVEEYVDGATLQSVVDHYKTGLPSEVVAAIACEICDALAYLHEHGIVHRDIKPVNVMISRTGLVKLVDFGIAALTGNSNTVSSITTIGTFVGTMRYAAPEMVSSQRYGPGSDIYALGVTILFMLLGRPPLEDAPLALLVDRILQGKLIDELPAPVAVAWRSILVHALDQGAEKRPSAKGLRKLMRENFLPRGDTDAQIIANFLPQNGNFNDFSLLSPVGLISTNQVLTETSLEGSIQVLSSQINEVRAAFADMTAAFRNQKLMESPDRHAIDAEGKIDQTFASVRRRLEQNWRVSLVMTYVLFSLFSVMLLLAVICGLIYQKSYWGILFGGTSALSLLTVVIWKPMDKMLFSTIATQQLELIQINYQRALNGNREERRESFQDVSAQLTALLTKVNEPPKRSTQPRKRKGDRAS
jgi:serine/threonine protein kinase